MTPTAISHRLRRLEEYCGQRLFHRRPRPIRLTDAGIALFPVVRDGLDNFADAVTRVRHDSLRRPLRVTTTNAFASRWLVPRLPGWRAAHPDIALEVLGTDRLFDLQRGEADIAIRYMEAPPPGLVSQELFRDNYILVASPALVSTAARSGLADLNLIESVWPEDYPSARTWQAWLARAAAAVPELTDIGRAGVIGFREELHAIQALISGQGVGICSDVLVAPELGDGRLVKVVDFALPGLGFYLVHVPDPPRKALLDLFASWIRSAR